MSEGFDNIRADVERRGPHPSPNDRWQDGTGPRRRARPGVVLGVILGVLVAAFVGLAVAGGGGTEPEGPSFAPTISGDRG